MSSLKDKLKAKRQAIADKGNGRERSYKWQNGETLFRILPGKGTTPEQIGEFYQEIGIHWIKDANGKTVTAVGDREICYGEVCPVREVIGKLIAHGKTMQGPAGDKIVEHGKDMLAKPRFYANVVILKAPGDFDPKKPVLAEFPEQVWDKLLSQILDYLEELPDDVDLLTQGPFSLEKGAVFVMEKSGSTKTDTKYNARITPKGIKTDRAIYDAAIDLASFKRAQFAKPISQALAVVGAQAGIDMTDIAGALSDQAQAKQIAGPSAASTTQPGSKWGDDEEVAQETTTTVEPESDDELVGESDDDLLAGLDDL